MPQAEYCYDFETNPFNPMWKAGNQENTYGWAETSSLQVFHSAGEACRGI